MSEERRGTWLAACAAAWTEERWITVEGWRIRYREAGSGPTIVLLHGLAVSADYWWRNGPALAAAGFRVIAPDLPGFGRTDGPRDGMSVPQQATALNSWALVMRLEPALFVGHSLSCQTVLEHAAWHPHQVAGLVLAAPTGDPARFRLVRQAVGLLRDAPRESWRLKTVVAQAYLRAGFRRAFSTWVAASRSDALARARQVRAPGVVILGTRDPVMRPAFGEALAGALPRGEVRWVPGGTHAVIYDTAREFNAEVVRFALRL